MDMINKNDLMSRIFVWTFDDLNIWADILDDELIVDVGLVIWTWYWHDYGQINNLSLRNINSKLIDDEALNIFWQKFAWKLLSRSDIWIMVTMAYKARKWRRQLSVYKASSFCKYNGIGCFDSSKDVHTMKQHKLRGSFGKTTLNFLKIHVKFHSQSTD